MEFLKEYPRNSLQAWWTEWKCQGFPHLLPYYTKASAKRHPNLEVGDVCQIQYKTKVTKHYRLCIVLEAKTSEDGIVRTVVVGLRNRRGKVMKSLPQERIEVGVQRLLLVLPKCEQNKEEEEQVARIALLVNQEGSLGPFRDGWSLPSGGPGDQEAEQVDGTVSTETF